MKVIDLIEKLNYQNYTTNSSLTREVSGVFIGDLLSYVMGNGEVNNVWVTVQAHLNVIAVASLREFSTIIVCKTPLTDDFINKAMEEDIAILYTDEEIYSVAKKLVNLGL